MQENAMAVPRLLPAVIAMLAMMAGCSTTDQNGEHKSIIPLPWKHKVTRVDPALPNLPAAGYGRRGYNQDHRPRATTPPR